MQFCDILFKKYEVIQLRFFSIWHIFYWESTTLRIIPCNFFLEHFRQFFKSFPTFPVVNMLYFPLIPCTGNEKNKDNSQFTFAKEKEIMKCECKKSFKPQKIWFDLNILKKCICQLIFFFHMSILRRKRELLRYSPTVF